MSRVYKIDGNYSPPEINPKIRVAVYARVSTRSDEQLDSLEAQKEYYETLVDSNPEWELAGLYADEGITGTSYKKRDQFNAMIADCEDGKIDRIITKSISRFARNTVDTIENIRRLKLLGIGIWFEKEKIWTLDGKGEFVLTLMAGFAQQEAQSISENTAWGLRKRMAAGQYWVSYSTFIGYGPGFAIEEDGAYTVRIIYKLFLQGYSKYQISKLLNQYGFSTATGHGKWCTSVVETILQNEKYKGDSLMQKEFTDNFLTKHKRKNLGELEQYYVTDGHEAIIPRELFDYCQEICFERYQSRYSGMELMDYYKNYIESRPDWEFVGMYSDEGISATNTKHRDGFNQMIEDALAGKIDLIITKSVSRFARNTVDSLQNVRKLKEKGIEIYFEKENIWTLDAKGELLISIMSSLAQEESRSISENTTWGKRKQFADGVVSVSYSTFLGYDKDFKINPEQAETVKLIYRLFLSGLSVYAITQELERRGLTAPAGGKKWHVSSVKSILTNEKYKGDALLQKEYTVDFLQKTKKKNEGEIPQYYVEGHHEAIIKPSEFDQAQLEMARREKMGRYSGVTIFSNKIQCGCCGGWFGSKVWHSTDKYRRVVYRCNRKYRKGEEPCSTPALSEDQIKQIFMKALSSLAEAKEATIQNLEMLMNMTCDTTEITSEQDRVAGELAIITQQIEGLIRENATVALDQEEYARKEGSLYDLYEEKKARYDELETKLQEKQELQENIEYFIRVLQGLDGQKTEFDEVLWGGLAERMIIQQDGSSKVIFKGGIEVPV